MRRISLVVAVVLIASVVMSACGGGGGGGGGAAAAAKAWFEAFAQLDLNKVSELTCEDQREALSQALSIFGGGDTGVDLEAMKDVIKIDVSGITYEEKGVNGSTATVHIAGALKISAFGQEQSQDVNEDVPVVNEGGAWKLCSAGLPGG